jgi:hypothetical protein
MGGPLNAAIADDGLRYYAFNDQKLVSVTSLRRVVGMPFALANWQVSQVVNAANLMRGTMAEKALAQDEYPKVLRKNAMQERDAAAALGSSVHAAADAGVRSIDLPDTDERKPFLVQYESWMASSMAPEIHMSESQVFHLTEGYAGSLDLVAGVKITGPRRKCLIDIKTGKGLYTDHAIQLALYMGGQFVGGFDPVEGIDVMFPEQTQHLIDCESMGILHLRPDGWQFVEIPFTDRLAAVALDMVHIARFYLDNPDISTLTGAIYP